MPPTFINLGLDILGLEISPLGQSQSKQATSEWVPSRMREGYAGTRPSTARQPCILQLSGHEE